MEKIIEKYEPLHEACSNLSKEKKIDEARNIIENYAENGFVEVFCTTAETQKLMNELRK